MKIRMIYGVIPVPVFYVKSLGWAAGRSNGFFVRIVEKYKDDKGLLEHELQHCRQFYRTFGLHGFLYKFSKKYRYNMEIECYRIQLKFCANRKATARKFAEFLTTRYDLDVSKARAIMDLN